MVLTAVHSSLIFLLVNQCNCVYSKTSVPPPPKPTIWLSFYTQVDSFEGIVAEEKFKTEDQVRNEFIIKNGSDFVILGDTKSATFICRGLHPLTWHFPNGNQIGHLAPYALEMHTERISEFPPNDEHPSNKYFEASLSLDFLYSDFFSVTIECKGAEASKDDTGTSSIHVFYEGKKVIERTDEIVQVHVSPTKKDDKSGSDTVTLPCRPATPQINILLEKQIAIKNKDGVETNKWVKFKTPTKYISFDPKLGFTLRKDTINDERSYVFGLYRCTPLGGGPDDSEHKRGRAEASDVRKSSSSEAEGGCVYVNVTSAMPKDIPLEILNSRLAATLQLKANASVEYNNQTFGNLSMPLSRSNCTHAGMGIRCCSGISRNPPSVSGEICQDPAQCQVLHQRIIQRLQEEKGLGWYSSHQGQGSNTFSEESYGCSRTHLRNEGDVICLGETVKFVQHFVQLFENGKPQLETRVTLETEKNMAMAPLPQKMLLVIGHSISGDELLRNRRYYHVQNGITLSSSTNSWGLKDVADNEETSYEEFQHFGVAYREARADKIAEYPRQVYYEGEPLVPVCVGWRHSFSQGGWLSILWRNGSRTVLETAPLPRSEFNTIYLSKERGSLEVAVGTVVHKIGQEIPASQNMTAVECWMPQWNSEKWDKITRNLTVWEGQAPQFGTGGGKTSTEEVVYYNMNESKGILRELECHVRKVSPEPRINMTKDGVGILGRFQGVNHSKQDFIPSKWAHLMIVSISDTAGSSTEATITAKIRFIRITSEIEGVYRCTAKNVRGKVTKTFRVVVLNKKTALLSILVATSLLLLLLLVVCVTHWKRRRYSR